MRKLTLAEPVQEIRLILIPVPGAAKMIPPAAFRDPGVMSGRQCGTIQLHGPVEQESELNKLITKNTG